ncbi:unnamed protein product [Caenorhabditis angaria]|uniref:glucuronosyltransferase n=1 Tax=Caenorhabditis angaria TaxID=860376 RepID=A0A9P1IXB3_9PELO|nr:unnamed protein product [Caenorhabditis angaria]
MFTLLLSYIQAAKILIYLPRMFQSHVALMANIANCLAENGHEVTVIDNIFRNDIGNYLGNEIYEILKIEPGLKTTELLKQGNLPQLLWKSRPEPEIQSEVIEDLAQLQRTQCLHLIENSTVVEQLQKRLFDLAINEVCDTCGIGLIELANIKKSIIISSTAPLDVVPWALGISSLFYDGSTLSDYGNEFGILDKIRNLKFVSAMLNFHEIQARDVEKAFQTKYGLKTSFFESMRKSNLLFNNINEMSDVVRSTSRRMLDIGGMAFTKPEKLTEEYQKIVADDRKKVLISFGTASPSSLMPIHFKSAILRAIELLPEYLFIWKYEIEDDFAKSASGNLTNIIFRKYIPQTNLLTAKILVYSPRMMQSHVAFMANIANCLAENGHEVTVIDNIFRNDIGNYLGNEIHEVLEIEPGFQVTELLKQGNLPQLLWQSRPEPRDQRELMEGLGNLHRVQCLHLIENSTIVEQLQERQFDLAIHEVFDTCGLGLIELANIKKSIIVSSTLPMDVVPWTLGISSLIYDGSLLSDYGNEFGILDKIRNLKFVSAMLNFHELQASDVEKAFQMKYGLKTAFFESMRKTNLLFNNINEMSDVVRSTSRRMLDIAGTSFYEPEKLTEEYQKIVSDDRKIILISFGTAATSSHMPTYLKSAILQAIKLLPEYLFIWKYEIEDDFTKSASGNLSNVVFRKYVPQTNLLNTGNISLFITHSGQNSMLESFQSGTKILAVPLFGDQHHNAKAAQEANLLEILPKKYLKDSTKIIRAIRKSMQENQTITDSLSADNPIKSEFFKNFKFGGHRGSPVHAPENTLESFKWAKEEGVDLVEFDVHITEDGEAILMHDETTKRTGLSNYEISKTKWETLKTVKLKEMNNVSSRICTLSETIDFCMQNNLKMLFDMKNDNIILIEKIVKEISSRKIYQHVLVSSFNPMVAYRLKKMDLNILTGLTYDRSYYAYSDDHRKEPFSSHFFGHWINEIYDELNMMFAPLYILPTFLGVDVLMMSYQLISENLVREAREKGFSVIAWTVNDKDYMKLMTKLNIPFLTDVPYEVKISELIGSREIA